MDNKAHWEKIYNTKPQAEVSWYQSIPEVSLNFIKELGIAKDAAIIDVGGGDSYLADYLLSLGYTNITVLDISEAAISRAKKRMGTKAMQINWVVSDIVKYEAAGKFDFWHDRATFHFLTSEEQGKRYLDVAQNALSEKGKMVMGTFSENGPNKCSGLSIKQYSEASLTASIQRWFKKIKCIYTDHITPFNTIQNFLFCSFNKITT